MSFKPYPSYKESGVEWAGVIPAQWAVEPLKRSTYIKARVGWKGLTSDEFEDLSAAYLVTGTDFKQKFIDWGSCYQVSQERYDDDPFIQLENGDLLITKDGTIGKLALVRGLDKPACLNSGIFVLRPLRSYSTEYLYWVLSSDVFKRFVDLTSYGSTILHLYQNVLVDFAFGVPSREEQQAIIDYLDRETAEIDAFITDQEELIGLLNERRKSVLDTVTSSVGNTSQIRLRYVFAQSRECDSPDSDVLSVYRDYGVIPKSSRVDNFNKTPEDVTRYLVVRPGYVVVNKMKAWQGSLGVSRYDGIVSPDYEVLMPLRDDLIDGYVHYLLRSPRLVSEYSVRSVGIRPSQWRLYWDQLGDISIPVPSIPDQRRIVERLDHETAEIDAMIADAKEAIELSKERRAALISAAVTGKIDVRDDVFAEGAA